MAIPTTMNSRTKVNVVRGPLRANMRARAMVSGAVPKSATMQPTRKSTSFSSEKGAVIMRIQPMDPARPEPRRNGGESSHLFHCSAARITAPNTIRAGTFEKTGKSLIVDESRFCQFAHSPAGNVMQTQA
ncbi:hypothetical protein Aeq9CBH6_05320 [Adlercreutzia equolifaciens]|nr:hypothetical protein Aeq9CBH6_05320 [Adlercreutzia equolifaciens]